ncbi:hypothetical protein D9M68_342690 [compost metagenome]
MQHQAVAVEALHRLRRLAAEVQLGVHVVLDQRHLVLLQQFVERALLVLAHARAERVLQVAHAPAGLDRQARQAVGEHLEVHALARVHGDLHRLELEPLEHLQGGVERRRLDGHQVAGAGHRLQAQVERFHRAVGDHQFAGRQHHPADHVAQCQLAAQVAVAAGHVGDDRLRRHVADALCHGARQARQREQVGGGEGRAERHGVRVLERVEHREHQFADVDVGGLRLAPGDLRLVQRALRVLADEVAGARAGDDQPAVLQQVVGLEHRGRADPVGAAGVAHRRHLLAGREHAAADQFGNLVGEFLVALHLVLVQKGRRDASVLYELLGFHATVSAVDRRDEGALRGDPAGRIVEVGDFEAQRLRTAGRALSGEPHTDRYIDDLAGRQLQLAVAVQLEAGGVRQRHPVAARLLGLVDHLEAVDVLDLPGAVLAEQAAVAGHVQGDQRARVQGPDEGADDQRQRRRVADQARAQQARLAAGQGAFGGVAHQAAGVAHLVHHAVAGVDAGAAADAVELQAVADVDAGRADLHAHLAVDAVAEAFGAVVAVLPARAAAFAPGGVVGDDQRVLVEHHALEARVGAHVQAHLLAQPAGVEVGGEGEEAQPEGAAGAEVEGQQVARQFADRREVADEGQRSEQAHRQPQAVLGDAAQRLLQRPGRGVELDALVALALGELLDAHEHPGPHALRAAVAAPHAAGEHGDEEQAEGADDQERREQDEILRPEGRAEDVELPRAEVPEHRLATVPVQPGGAEEQQEQEAGAVQPQVAVQAGEAAGVDRPAGLRRGQPHRAAGVDRLDDLRGNAFGHGGCLIRAF